MNLLSGDIVQVVDGWIARNAYIMILHTRQYTSTPDDHIWIDGYVLDPTTGLAIERRDPMFLMLAHLKVIRERTDRTRQPRRSANAGPMLPAPRTPQQPAVTR